MVHWPLDLQSNLRGRINFLILLKKASKALCISVKGDVHQDRPEEKDKVMFQKQPKKAWRTHALSPFKMGAGHIVQHMRNLQMSSVVGNDTI